MLGLGGFGKNQDGLKAKVYVKSYLDFGLKTL
jgi:hypothetical protein